MNDLPDRGRALIIEDEMLIALEIEGHLSDFGYTTFDWADSPQGALELAQAHRPDLITADMRIIGGTGLEAVRMIVEAVGPVPVVYVTANADMLQDEPAATVVSKPIQPHELREACVH